MGRVATAIDQEKNYLEAKDSSLNIDLDFEYLRPPIEIMTLKKDDIIFRNFEVVNIGKVKERLVYHDYCTYTEQERQD